jgi:small subunit ribosomal protein S2
MTTETMPASTTGLSISMKQLLESGVHFGHQSRRWNPKMKQYIYTERNGIYIIDLKKTLKMLREACQFVRDSVAEGKTVLFVGTKKQAKDSIREAAQACGMHHVNNRWLGGMLTNFRTVRKSVIHLLELDRAVMDGTIVQYSKKEQSRILKERASLEKNLAGVKMMERLPDILFVIDPHKEQIAVREANKCGITAVAIVDTNCDPDPIDWVIPGNDDAIRAIKLISDKISEAVREGLMIRAETGGFATPMDTQTALAAAAAAARQTDEVVDLSARYAQYQADEETRTLDEYTEFYGPDAAPAQAEKEGEDATGEPSEAPAAESAADVEKA